MRFYFFQSKCVVIVSSPCDLPTREGLYRAKGLTKFVRFREVLSDRSDRESGPPQMEDQWFRSFSGWTEPIHWVLDRNFGGMDRARYIEVLFHIFLGKENRLLYRGLRYIEVDYIVVAQVWVRVMFVSSFCGRLVKEKEVWSVFSVGSLEKLSTVNAYVGELKNLGQGWKRKHRTQISIRRRWRGTDTMIFELLR